MTQLYLSVNNCDCLVRAAAVSAVWDRLWFVKDAVPQGPFTSRIWLSNFGLEGDADAILKLQQGLMCLSCLGLPWRASPVLLYSVRILYPVVIYSEKLSDLFSVVSCDVASTSKIYSCLLSCFPSGSKH